MALNSTTGDITCPDGSTICSTMDEAGAGIGLFLTYLVAVLPTFLIVLALIGGIVLIVGGVAYAIRNAVSKGYTTK